MTPEQAAGIQAQIDRQTAEMGLYQSVLATMDGQIAALQSPVDAKQGEIDAINAQIQTLNASLKAAQDERDQLAAPLAEAQGKRVPVQANADALAQAIDGCKTLLAAQ